MKIKNTLRYKIGQMLIMGFEGSSIDEHSFIVQAIQSEAIGGVILFDYNFQTKTFEKNIQNPQQVQKLNQALQQTNTAARQRQDQPNLPLIISVDYEGGKVNRLQESYGFPATYSPVQISQMDDESAAKVAHDMAMTLKNLGFNLDFAPLIDVNVNPNNPIIGALDRSFSSNPASVAHYAKLFSDTFATHKIQCSYKHFPGHGSSQHDSHLGFVDVTDTWQENELEPYERLFAAPNNWCQMVMTAHIINRNLDPTGLPATLSHPILTGLLRDKLQFKGVIITDDMQMKAISDHYRLEESIPMAINAGADMFIFGNQLSDTPQDPKAIIDLIEQQVLQGTIPMSAIDDSYQRIAHFKNCLM